MRNVALPVTIAPYPHIIADNVLTAGEVSDCLKHWPEQSELCPEPGGLKRHWIELCVQNKFTPTINEYWKEFFKHRLLSIYYRISEQFAPYIVHRFGPLSGLFFSQLTLIQADNDFILHDMHTHYPIGPDWIFTTLIHLDDNDQEDRGSRLYRPQNIESLHDGNMLNRLKFAANLFPELEPTVDTGFRPGRLVAFLESPLALHGSTPFNNSKAYGTRKMIRLHMLVPKIDLHKRFGVEHGGQFHDMIHSLIASEGIYESTTSPSYFDTALQALNADFDMEKLWRTKPKIFQNKRNIFLQKRNILGSNWKTLPEESTVNTSKFAQSL